MKFQYMIVYLLFFVACNLNSLADNIGYLEERNFQLEKENGKVYIATAVNLVISNKDIGKICTSGPVAVIFFRHSQIEKGAIDALEDCDKLKTVHYEEETKIIPEDLILYDRVPNLESLIIRSNTYGDELMPYLGKLKNVEKIYFTADMVKSGDDYITGEGKLTDEGIRLFAEARKNDNPVDLIIQDQLGITTKSFEYFLEIKGLEGINFGSNDNLTYEDMDKFYKAYLAKYGVKLKMTNHGNW